MLAVKITILVVEKVVEKRLVDEENSAQHAKWVRAVLFTLSFQT